MGVACLPDIFQSVMMDVLGDLDYVFVYINDILIVPREVETEVNHLQKVATFLQLDTKKSFTTNNNNISFNFHLHLGASLLCLISFSIIRSPYQVVTHEIIYGYIILPLIALKTFPEFHC
jgi:hypothetical protein